MTIKYQQYAPFRIIFHVEAVDLENIPLVPRTFRIAERNLEQKMEDGMWEIISLVVNRLLSPRITDSISVLRLLRRKKRARSLESNAISFIFAYHESRGNTIVAWSRETRDRSSSANQTKNICSPSVFELRAYLEMTKSFILVLYRVRYSTISLASNSIERARVSNNMSLLFNSLLYKMTSQMSTTRPINSKFSVN